MPSNISFSQLPQTTTLLGNAIIPIVQNNLNYTVAASLVGSNYSDANVAAYLPTYTGNIGGGNISISGAIQGPTITAITASTTGLTAAIGATNSNVSNTNSNVATLTTSVTGLGAQVTSLTGVVYTNSNVAAYIPTDPYIGSITGNVTALQGQVYTNSNVAGYLPTYTGALASLTGNVTTTANIQGTYIKGDGSLLTNLPAGNYSNANVAAYLPTNTVDITANNISTIGNITLSGNISLGNITTVGDNPTIYGNFDGATNSRLLFRSTVPSRTTIAAIPPFGWNPSNGTPTCGVASFVSSDQNNSQYITQVTFANTSVGMVSARTGTSLPVLPLVLSAGSGVTPNLAPFTIQANSTAITMPGAVSIGSLSATGDIQGGNLSVAGTVVASAVTGDTTTNLTAAGFKSVYYNPTTGQFAYSTGA